MKTKFVIIVLLLLIATLLFTRNDERITDTLLNVINPIKQSYQKFTQDIKDKSQSYLFQQESIERLNRENQILRKRLYEQTHYIRQIKDIYDTLPQLHRLPAHTISITETISYVKLNSFSQIILTKPKNLKENKLYGLIQKNVVAGTAQVKNNQLYGYLTSDKKCRFSVFVGEAKAPGIAEGVEQNKMMIKYIPKWHDINPGDKVMTSGLDAIFFEGIPVGIVTGTEVHSSYKIAYIKTYSDIFHPRTFFLINDAKVTLAEGFDSNKTQLKSNYFTVPATIINDAPKYLSDMNETGEPVISNIPKRIDQTQEETIEPETPSEVKKPENRKQLVKPEEYDDKLDLF